MNNKYLNKILNSIRLLIQLNTRNQASWSTEPLHDHIGRNFYSEKRIYFYGKTRHVMFHITIVTILNLNERGLDAQIPQHKVENYLDGNSSN